VNHSTCTSNNVWSHMRTGSGKKHQVHVAVTSAQLPLRYKCSKACCLELATIQHFSHLSNTL
jgi:hypothetical protein